MPEQKLLERNKLSGVLPAQSQRTGTKAANRAGGDFENEHAVFVDAAFSVNGAMSQADRRHGAFGGAHDRFLDRHGRRRWCDVEGLFEIRTVERIGLVEDG